MYKCGATAKKLELRNTSFMCQWKKRRDVGSGVFWGPLSVEEEAKVENGQIGKGNEEEEEEEQEENGQNETEERKKEVVKEG